jgi:hypothetical protein
MGDEMNEQAIVEIRRLRDDARYRIEELKARPYYALDNIDYFEGRRDAFNDALAALGFP